MGERTEADAGGMVQTVIVIGKDISYAVRSTENLPLKDIGLSRNKNIDRLLTPKPSLGFSVSFSIPWINFFFGHKYYRMHTMSRTWIIWYANYASSTIVLMHNMHMAYEY